MKKLAILLGALAVASTAFAGGKETAPKKAEVKTVYVEKPVYVDRTRTVFNGGYVDMQYKWWGSSTIHKATEEKDGGDWKHRATNSNRGRFQLLGSVNLTENDNVYFRVRDDHAIGHYSDKIYGERDKQVSSDVRNIRLRFNHKHDFFDKRATSRLAYRNGNGDLYTDGVVKADHDLAYSLRFNFADFMFDNDFIKTTDFTVAPTVGYAWAHAGSGLHGSRTWYGGIDFNTYHKLPWNFGFEVNVYARYFNNNLETGNSDKGKGIFEGRKNNFFCAVEAYLTNVTPIVTFDKATLSFYFEGGLDPYTVSARKVYAHNTIINTDDDANGKLIPNEPDNHTTYTLYALPGFRVDYQLRENIDLYAVVGANYSNGDTHTNGAEAQGWVVQPVVWGGFRVKF